jgi:hypothetical protein
MCSVLVSTTGLELDASVLDVSVVVAAEIMKLDTAACATDLNKLSDLLLLLEAAAAVVSMVTEDETVCDDDDSPLEFPRGRTVVFFGAVLDGTWGVSPNERGFGVSLAPASAFPVLGPFSVVAMSRLFLLLDEGFVLVALGEFRLPTLALFLDVEEDGSDDEAPLVLSAPRFFKFNLVEDGGGCCCCCCCKVVDDDAGTAVNIVAVERVVVGPTTDAAVEEGSSNVVRSLKEVDGRNAPRPSSNAEVIPVPSSE